MGVFDRRLGLLREEMSRQGVDCLYLFPGHHMGYLTGHVSKPPKAALSRVRLKAAIIPAEGEPVFVVPPLEEAPVRKTTWIQDVRPLRGSENHFEAVAAVLAEKKLAKGVVGIEETAWWGGAERLRAVAPGIVLKDVTPSRVQMRLCKDEEEIANHRKACELADIALTAAIQAIEPGKTELDLAGVISSTVIANGGQCELVQLVAGPGRYPEEPGWRKVEKGEIVLLDVNASYRGYYSDVTRMAVVGPPTEDQKRIHSVVLAAQNAALAAAKPGVSGEYVDAVGRKVIEDAGYGEFFTHGIGHGLGVEGHEGPSLAQGSKALLEAGTVHTLEPAIIGRKIGKFTIRIEDVALVTPTGCELLTKSTRELVQV